MNKNPWCLLNTTFSTKENAVSPHVASIVDIDDVGFTHASFPDAFGVSLSLEPLLHETATVMSLRKSVVKPLLQITTSALPLRSSSSPELAWSIAYALQLDLDTRTP